MDKRPWIVALVGVTIIIALIILYYLGLMGNVAIAEAPA
jgi:hypothetical protein